MLHTFYHIENKNLLQLRLDLMQTLNNPKCEMLTTPVNNTISQIEREMELRGLTVIKKIKQVA